MRIIICTPSPAELVPSPYKQGESAIRTFHSAGFIIQTYNNLRLPQCPSRLLVPRLLVY